MTFLTPLPLVLATHNPSKVTQILPLLAGLPLEVRTLADLGVTKKPDEVGTTVAENALIKARAAYQDTGEMTLAEDTILEIDVLGGLPGLRTGRWAGENVPTEETTRFALKQMEPYPRPEQRTAIFTTVAVLITKKGVPITFTGAVRGHLLTHPRVAPQPNMPYSPLFVPKGETEAWAEMDTEKENRLSHRGQAIRQVRDYLQTLLHND